MPELPEVQTTVDGINKMVKGRVIEDVRTTYDSPFYKKKDEIKNPVYFKTFREKVIGQKIIKAERRAKNILIRLSGGDTILVHMKMTGHFVYDRPSYPYARLDFTLDNGKRLILSDLRKFAKVTLLTDDHLQDLGPEPLDKNFQFPIFKFQLMKRPKGRIKQALMDPAVIAGIGNIYSDEILWRASIHPLSLVGKIPEKNLKEMYKAMKELLQKGIKFGGDSTSDYKNIMGEPGAFQAHHRAYQKHKTKCARKHCSGVLEKVSVGGRSAHFCPIHQKLYR